MIGGGGFVTGIIPHPQCRDLMYARTDVGGAYRWNGAARRWEPITDAISPDDWNLTGIESLAVDPRDTNRVYLAAGTYCNLNAAMLRSADQGRTWSRAEVPFRMGANEMGRFNGERLAVDPNRGDILFFGSRRQGLWRSDDGAASWQRVAGFPEAPAEAVPGSRDGPGRRWFNQPVGIVCVAFHPAGGRPGRPTPILYAAVSTSGTNLFRSTDGGTNWAAVPNQPVGLRPNHLVIAPDGMLYLTYGRESGPNMMTDGAVWTMDPRHDRWSEISPVRPAADGLSFGYGGISLDAQQPGTIMVTTFGRWQPHDEAFRSTNGGATWSPLLAQASWDYSSAPYARDRTPHWMGDIEINPLQSDQVWFTTGYGVWCCVNATKADSGQPTQWVFLNDGLEETVPLALLSPPQGAHLLSGVGDIDGFRHDDLTRSPADGSYPGPRYGNTEDMAFAGLRPEFIVRCGVGGPTNQARAAFSTNGGKNWTALAGEPPSSGGAGTITVSADARTIVWTPRRCGPFRTTDHGGRWTPCDGLSRDARVWADAVNGALFYAIDARAGKFFASTNGGMTFVAVEQSPLPWRDFNGGSLCVTPGVAGDLWVAFPERGLWHSTNSGATFVQVAGVQRARAVGCGKAAPGRVTPALFLSGTIANVQGVFRSDDSGRSWVRINDERHQFGGFSRLVGDPRIYGRVYAATAGRGIVFGERTVE